MVEGGGRGMVGLNLLADVGLVVVVHFWWWGKNGPGCTEPNITSVTTQSIDIKSEIIAKDYLYNIVLSHFTILLLGSVSSYVLYKTNKI